ncbi:hypothetical protein PAXRUDRAFT_828798 [Paxillus rubicundulus Ve08.2h10]|uniref:Methyltransferase domain-containing protein n=1 Tax=Paxillus rubicundulus Ve08.2h10 TaxID=930991 RepID=A0A0D0DVM3_9AGAM|nr:hypothetical protein PAXRUDRAFT_828798 [Paxillus rubicundulus Ve08.2h10]
MTAITIHVKDVDNELAAKPIHRRPTGEIISPLDYTNDVVNFDHWDHMFLTNCCKSLTLYNFDGPPATILDLGCGRGLWAIEAAKQWQGSMVVGFDVVSRQPKLSLLDKNLSRRLKWVHGNLLDGLPFLNGQFNFVRMVRMGLHIPEDEWGNVLGEISRVLHPNGVLEIIEEDLIFPSQTPQSSDVLPGGSSNESCPRSSNTLVSNQYHKSDPSMTTTSLKSNSTQVVSGASSASLPLSVLDAELRHPEPPDPRDHTRLKRAWEEMLNDSFLAPELISILPFHLGAWFREIRSHPPLRVPLPPPSSRRPGVQPVSGLPGLIDPDALFELRSLSRKSSPDSDNDPTSTSRKSSQRGMSSWASMHLGRSVRTIMGCKEPIWQAYERLYGQDPSLPSLVRTAKPEYLKKHFDRVQSTANPLRDYFERDWINWENDMADRTCVRGSIQSELSWDEPPGEPPEWRGRSNSMSPLVEETECEEKTDLCRSLRGFVCFQIRDHTTTTFR